MNTACTAMYPVEPASVLTNWVAMRWTPQSVSRPARSRSPRNPVLRPRCGQNSTPAAICARPRPTPTMRCPSSLGPTPLAATSSTATPMPARAWRALSR